MTPLLLAMILLPIAAAFRIRRAADPVLYGFGKADTMPLRGLLALVVMFSHLDTKTQFAVPVLHLVHWATPAVAVFFFLSGYGLVKSYSAAESFGRMPGYWHAFHLLIGPSFALIFYAFEWLRRVRPLAFVGAISYEVYLLHGVVLKNLLPLGWPPAIAVAAVALVTIGLSFVLNLACRGKRRT